ncbi:MAG: RluA family pseudouridine synthase [Lachnospiraceae bacterium]|nr:RluA family pseudouridine synthase [Lachnospiraceae bacterium]
MTEYHLLVEEVYEGYRLDKYLAEVIPGLSRSYLQRVVRENGVLAGGRAVKGSYRVGEGEEIYLQVPEAVIPEIAPEQMLLDILYEDGDVILVNKPKNMVVHPAPGHYSGTLVNGLLYHCGKSLSGINGVLRPGIVHRIDKDTTGVIIACKNDGAHRCLAEQLKEHSITRCYRAIVHGAIREEEGVVDAPLGRHPVDRKRMAVVQEGGKEAVTHYRVLERFSGYTYVECRLETGRTHQIRVHMTSIGHPLLGDVIYGNVRAPFRLEGQTLHAMTLGFVHPSTKAYMEFQAPVPKYFVHLLEVLRQGHKI